AERLAAVGHAPADHVARRVMINMQIERDVIIEPEIFAVKRIAFEHAQAERDGPAVLPPYEEAHLVGHAPAHLGEIGRRELLEMHARATIDLQVKRIELVDERGDISLDLERDRGCTLGGAEFEPKIATRLAAERALHVNLEARVIDVEAGHRQARNPREAAWQETCERAAISCRKFL